jgi:hypothetical protein
MGADRTAEQLYQTIASAIVEVVPAGWVSVSLEARMADDVGAVDFFYRGAEGSPRRFDPGVQGFDTVDQSFAELRELMKSTGHAWSTARFALERSGKFHIDFDYEHLNGTQ